MTRTRIKICGITNSRDAEFAVASEVDALGFNLYEESPRYVDVETAAGIVAMSITISSPARLCTLILMLPENQKRGSWELTPTCPRVFP